MHLRMEFDISIYITLRRVIEASKLLGILQIPPPPSAYIIELKASENNWLNLNTGFAGIAAIEFLLRLEFCLD